jgi:hypothetical protein
MGAHRAAAGKRNYSPEILMAVPGAAGTLTFEEISNTGSATRVLRGMIVMNANASLG